jgi:hypothetical protein
VVCNSSKIFWREIMLSKKIQKATVGLFLLGNVLIVNALPTFTIIPSTKDATLAVGDTTLVSYTITNNSAENFPKVGVKNTFPTEVADAQAIVGGTCTTTSFPLFPLAAKASCTLDFELTGTGIGQFEFLPEICEFTAQLYCSRPEADNQLLVLVTDSAGWVRVGTTGPGNNFIASLSNLNNDLYAGTGGTGLFKFVNNNWDLVGNSAPGNGSVFAVTEFNNALYTGTGVGVFQLQGSNWEIVGNNQPGAGNVSTLIDDNGTLLAGTFTVNIDNESLFTFNTASTMWDAVNNACNAGSGVLDLQKLDGIIYAGLGGQGVYSLTDCTRVGSSGPGNAYLLSLLFASDDILYAGTQQGGIGGGPFLFNAEGNWVPVGTQLADCEIYGLVESAGIIFAASNGGVNCLNSGVFALLGGEWLLVGGGLPGGVNPVDLTLIGDTLYAGTFGQGVWSLKI